MPDEETLQDAISRYIREPPYPPPNPPHNAWTFTRRDAAWLAEATGATQEEVEREFFGLCGTVWAGWLQVRGEHGERYANGRTETPEGWTGTVRFQRELMWGWSTLPERYPPH